MTTYFKTKQQYIAFRKAWAAAHQAKILTREHQILFNVVCNKPITHGFTPTTNITKLQNGQYINHGLYWGSTLLNQLTGHSGVWAKSRGMALVQPFGDAFTYNMLRELTPISIPYLDSTDIDIIKAGINNNNARGICTTFADIEQWISPTEKAA
jgi:hypothetical protein